MNKPPALMWFFVAVAHAIVAANLVSGGSYGLATLNGLFALGCFMRWAREASK